MARLNQFIAAFALAFATVFVVAPAATAQGATVVVIDQAQIMRDSKAGKDIAGKVAAIENQMKAELEPRAQSLETEGKAIEAKTANMTREAMAADAALRTEVQAYAQRAQQYQNDRGLRAQDLALTERKAWSDFFQALQPVLQEVVNEKGAAIMLDRSEVVYAGPSVDVTADVITKLDARTPTMTVTRQSAQALAAAGAPAQPAQQ